MPAPRKRLPAYGRELWHRRNAGQHPDHVWCIYARRFDRRPEDGPSVFVGEDWRPGLIDWTVVEGLEVYVVDRCAIDPEPSSVLPLAAEIAAHAEPVIVHWREWQHEPFDAPPGAIGPGWMAMQADIGHLAFAESMALKGGRRAWPAWWSDDLERDYQARRLAKLEEPLTQLEET